MISSHFKGMQLPKYAKEEIEKKMTPAAAKELIAIDERINSYQFQISQKIFGKRIRKKLTRNQAAIKVNLSLNRYTQIEQGIDLVSSKEEYLAVLNKL